MLTQFKHCNKNWHIFTAYEYIVLIQTLEKLNYKSQVHNSDKFGIQYVDPIQNMFNKISLFLDFGFKVRKEKNFNLVFGKDQGLGIIRVRALSSSFSFSGSISKIAFRNEVYRQGWFPLLDPNRPLTFNFLGWHLSLFPVMVEHIFRRSFFIGISY